ncbi:hypothetical protein DYQ86_15925 [Acidobacteria bacterium AB60]|nr:hypothetical protein DYQ86_15925 [Acidobacteria bacterium AB60]
MNNVHNSDGDCVVDPETNCCSECGVEHGDPCPECGKKAFHAESCSVEAWIRERENPGTLANAARVAFENGITCERAEEVLRSLYAFEALVRNGGNQCRTAEQLGVHRNSIGRLVKVMRVRMADVRKIAKYIGAYRNGRSSGEGSRAGHSYTDGSGDGVPGLRID